ncbi:hypothetical protein MNBD_GAMMA01-1262 [hydrothermal vent metagenome]|uniref:N-acetyltransferase domain-containing protein n=1 Tax=hydrothermal vent metagenome TaxID=652676 RepID=A0A3B0V9R8_9ZZZZ
MTKVHFDKMQISDLNDVLQLEIDNYAVPWSKGVMQDCIKAGYQCIVVKQDSIIIGYAFLMTAYDESHLLNMCINHSFQGQGLGRRLLKYLENICIYSNSKVFVLEVRESHSVAQRLYKSFGFTQVGLRKNYYKCLNGKENAIVMTKQLQVSQG